MSAVSPSNSKIEAAYRERIAEHRRPARTRLAIIFVKARKGMSPARSKELEARMDEVRSSALALPPEEAFFGDLATSVLADLATQNDQ